MTKLDELKSERLKIQNDNLTLLYIGGKTAPQAGSFAIILGLIIGIVGLVTKLIKHGAVAWLSLDIDVIWVALIENFLLLTVTTLLAVLVIYIFAKPIDAMIRNNYRKLMTDSEYIEYTETQKKINKLKIDIHHLDANYDEYHYGLSTLTEFKNEKEKIESEYKQLLDKGKQADSHAGVNALISGFFVGIACIIAKIIKHGAVAWLSSSTGIVLGFLIENLLIYVGVTIALYIVIKPFDVIVRKKYKQEMTDLEYMKYKAISEKLQRINSQIDNLTPKPTNISNSDSCYSCAYYGVDSNYDGYCKRFNNKYVDRYNTACGSYESRSR